MFHFVPNRLLRASLISYLDIMCDMVHWRVVGISAVFFLSIVGVGLVHSGAGQTGYGAGDQVHILATQGAYVDFACQDSKITINGVQVCNDGTHENVYMCDSGGANHPCTFSMEDSPDAGYGPFYGWSTYGDAFLEGPCTLHGSANNPVQLCVFYTLGGGVQAGSVTEEL